MSLFRTTALGSVIAIVLAGLFGAAPAAAADGDEYETQSKTVSTHGLDLTTEAGQAALHRRIAIAAASVCGGYPRSASYDRCWADAVADASVQANVLIAKASAATLAVADAGASRP
jgi:UrcA family protein